MAELKVEHAADGKEIVYRVYVHPEVFNWLSVDDLSTKMTEQFEALLVDALQEMCNETKDA